MKEKCDIFANFSMFQRKICWCHHHHGYFQTCLFNSHLAKNFIM